MKFSDLRNANRTRLASDAFHHARPFQEEHWALAIAGEAGELANVAKKRFRGDNIPVEKLIQEIGDVVIYCDLMASYLNYELEDIVEVVFNMKSKEIGSNVFITAT